MAVIGLTATVLSVEFILVICALFSRVPVAVDLSFVHSIVWHYQRNFYPQRNLFLYTLWTVLGTSIYALLLWVVKFSKWRSKWDLNPFFMLHVLIVCLMSHAAFEIVAKGNPVWAWPVFWGAFATGLIVSIFWPEFQSGVSYLKHCYAFLKIKPWAGVVLGCLFIFLVIFMPDLQAFVAMQYMGDYFRDWDVEIGAAVYAIAHGLIPDIDVTTTYGLGASVMVAKMINLMGGFEYSKLITIVMWVGIVYFVLWFLLLRRFLASTLLAFAAIVWAMRMHMFNAVLEPSIWVTLSSSVLRFCFDIGVFWMLWMHIQTRRTFFLAAGAFLVSLGVYHLMSTGISMFLVFGLYTFFSAFLPCLGGGKDSNVWRNHALVIGSVFVWTILWFYLTVGTHLFEISFFQNFVEFNSYFIKGAMSSSLTGPLLGNNVLMGIGGLLYPVFYLATFFSSAGEVISGKARGCDVFAGLLAFYGLEAHAYYMLMATQWYTMGIPGVFLLFYWIAKALEKLPVLWSKRIAWGLLVAALYCLVTERMFTGYPNLLNFSSNPIVDTRVAIRVGPKQIPYFNQLMADFPENYKLPVNSLGEKDERLKFEKDFADDAALKDYYTRQTALSEDAALIRRLIPDGGRAAVLSSFELLFLQRADRKPFFYYFPLIDSMPLTSRVFTVTLPFGYPQIQKTLDQLEAQKPPYIFMERIFLTPQVPRTYFYEYDDLIILLRYCFSKYEPVEIGKYLMAMKRKGE